ncbi:MAG: Uncharacterized protein FD130_549 [Halothiobacillaceae bacterium]|nr:MAG: Uncharacterized protein FD130_549 [Halothiobacillaceae bacterium]
MTKPWILALPAFWLVSSVVLADQTPEATACVYLINTSSAQKPEQHTTTPWYFWRSDHRVETRNAHGESGEVWELNARGQIFYTKLFHPAGKAIDYTPGDLSALALNTDWNQIRSIIDPKLLGTHLKRSGEQTVDNQRVERYAGTVDGVSTEVLWLPEMKLPVRIDKIQGGVAVSLRLAECKPLASAPWVMTSDAQMQSYKHLDYADLGDKENDPFVKSVISHNEGSHHGH